MQSESIGSDPLGEGKRYHSHEKKLKYSETQLMRSQSIGSDLCG